MHTHSTLYTRDSTGKIRIWYMEEDGNRYRTVSGVIDSDNLVTTEWTTVVGKNIGKANETSGEAQAHKEVQAKYKKQLKTGYHLNRSNIDAEGIFEPMLAKNFKDYEDKINWAEGVIVQVKFNGFRCIATRHGLFTRKGEAYVSVPHVHQDLIKFFEAHPDAVLDGELFNYEYRQSLNEISKLCRKTVNVSREDLKRSEQLIRYYVYDGYGFGAAATDGYVKRKKHIDAILPQNTKYIRHVDDYIVHSRKELDEVYESFLRDEQEGAIIRILNKPYENKRSKYLLKHKPIDDTEVTIINIAEGTGNWAGTGKIITCKDKDGRVFDATFKGCKEDCVQFLKDKDKWVGKEVTIIYNGLTGLGTPNYARMDYNNCLKK